MSRMKSVVMVGGGIQEVEAIRAIKEAGFFSIVTDRNKNAECFKYANLGVVIDGKDVESLIAFVHSSNKRYNIKGIFTLVNLTTSVSIVTSICGLPGINPVSAVIGQNKLLMKENFLKNDIPTPAYLEVSSVKEAEAAFDELGGDVFIKAINSFGGQGCRHLSNKSDLEKMISDAFEKSSYPRAIIEEHVEGDFHDMNGIFYNNKFYPAGIVDSYFIDKDPNGNDISPIEHLVESQTSLSEDKQRILYKLLEKAARSIGISFGPVGGDAIWTPKGPILLEIAPRYHGPANSLWMTPHSIGTKPVQAAVEVLAGRELNKDLIEPKFNKVCINKLIMPNPGRIVDIKGIKEALKVPGVIKIFLFKSIGDTIEYRNSTDVPCSVFVVGESKKEARDLMSRVESIIEIKTK